MNKNAIAQAAERRTRRQLTRLMERARQIRDDRHSAVESAQSSDAPLNLTERPSSEVEPGGKR